MAQCAETVTQTGCRDCLTVAYRNIQGCLPNANGRSIDAACFMRYSETAFFADNQTTDILPFLGRGNLFCLHLLSFFLSIPFVDQQLKSQLFVFASRRFKQDERHNRWCGWRCSWAYSNYSCPVFLASVTQKVKASRKRYRMKIISFSVSTIL